MSAPEITGAAPPRRIVVFTGDLSFQVRKGIVMADGSIEKLSWLVLVHSPRRKPMLQLVRSQWFNLRRNGWRRIPEVLAEAWRRVVGVRVAARSEQGSPGEEFTSAAFESRPNVKVVRVADIHAPESLALVRDFDAQLGLALAAPILRRPLFALPSLGTLNLHKGRLPDYRGMPPAFWELWNGETSVGCSVHWVDDKLDTGAVVARDVVQCEPFSTLQGLQLQLAQVGNDLVCSALTRVLDGTAQAEPQAAAGRTYRKPTLAQFAELERRLAARQPRHEPAAKTLFKAVLGRGSHAIWRWGHRLLPPRITVLLYHRVTDAVRDNLTTGIAQFDRQMGLLRKHCRVLSLEEVLDTKAIPRSRQPLVCVTFDDGYRDNHDHAVPILVRHQLPAAFFVATGIVGTELPFPHDRRRGNGPIPNMSWTQLKSMRQMGFTIGSHTVNHIDCASEPEAVVWDELTRSRDTLRRELGIQDVALGYPYGGREHMTPQRLDLVRQAGYAGCLSAYGGVNLRSIHAFDVRRSGIHWGFSDAAFMRQFVGIA